MSMNDYISGFIKDAEGRKRFPSVAYRCKMGDTDAMMEMAELLFESCSDRQKEVLLEPYEVAFRLNYDTAQEGYMMWISRAAFYGNKKAAEILKEHKIYCDKALFPHYGLIKGYEIIVTTYSGLWRDAGIVDLPDDKRSCGLIYHGSRGYYTFYYQTDYIGPDPEGFGAESEYQEMYLDRFFCMLDLKNSDQNDPLDDALKKNEAIREEYWKQETNRARGTKYVE